MFFCREAFRGGYIMRSYQIILFSILLIGSSLLGSAALQAKDASDSVITETYKTDSARRLYEFSPQKSAKPLFKKIKPQLRPDLMKGWGRQINIHKGDSTVYPYELKADGHGNFMAVFEERVLPEQIMYAFPYRKGGGWQEPVEVFRSDRIIQGRGLYPDLDMTPDGKAIIVWVRKANLPDDPIYSEWGIIARRFDPGTGWGGTFPVGYSDAGKAYPKVAIAADGSAVFVWKTGKSDEEQILLRRMSPEGNPSPIVKLASGDQPEIAMTPDGHALVVWRDKDGKIFLKQLTPGIRVSLPGGLFSPAIELGVGWHPEVTYSSNDIAAATWQHEGNVQVRHFSSDGWSEKLLLGSGSYPEIASSPDGHHALLFEGPDGEVLIRIYQQEDGRWGEAFYVGMGEYPELSMSPEDGTTMVIWRTTDGYKTIAMRQYKY
jgi:hypothetical protein